MDSINIMASVHVVPNVCSTVQTNKKGCVLTYTRLYKSTVSTDLQYTCCSSLRVFSWSEITTQTPCFPFKWLKLITAVI